MLWYIYKYPEKYKTKYKYKYTSNYNCYQLNTDNDTINIDLDFLGYIKKAPSFLTSLEMANRFLNQQLNETVFNFHLLILFLEFEMKYLI